jgi:hypothetical protein
MPERFSSGMGRRHRGARLGVSACACAEQGLIKQDKRITEIWEITSSPPDYIVLVSRARKPRQGRPA